MSLRSILTGLLPFLNDNFGTRIKDADGKKKDTQVQPLADVLRSGIMSEAPIELTSPITLVNRTDQPAIQIINLGPRNQQSGISITNEAGQQTNLGIGLGSQGILANEFIPLAPFAIDPQISWLFLGQGDLPTNQNLDNQGIPIPSVGPGTQPGQTNPGFPTQTGQPYLPGVPIGGSDIPTQPTTLPNSPYVPGNQGNPFTLHSILPQAIAAATGKTIVIVGGCGITVTKLNNKYTVTVSGSALAGAGLTATDCSLAVNAGDGIEVVADAVKAKVSCGLELSGGSIRVKRGDLIQASGGLATGSGTCDLKVDLPALGGVSGTFEAVDGEPEFDPDTCTLTINTKTITVTNGLITNIP